MIVIASEAKQSIVLCKERMDCFVASAPRNDGECTAIKFVMSGLVLGIHVLFDTAKEKDVDARDV